MMTNIVDCPQTPEALELDMKLEVAFEKLDDDITLPAVPSGEGAEHHAQQIRSPSSAPPRPPKLGVIPDMSQIQLHADAALNAMADAGLKPSDIDGIATAGRDAAADRALSRHHADLGRRHRASAAARSCCMSATPRPRSRPACARPC